MSDEEKKKDDPYALKDIFTEMEMELIESLQRNLTKHKLDEINAGFSWEMWQKAMLRNIQRYRNEIKRIIDGYRPAVQDAISETLQGTYDKAAEAAQKTMEQAQIKLDAGSFSFPEDGKNTSKVGETPPNETQFFDINRKKMDALIKSTTNDFEDANYAIYRKMDDVYRQTIFKTEFHLSSGAISLDAAIDKATESFLAKGIDCIVYKNGNHVNIATYAEMALRTASQRAKFLADGTKRDEFGRHLVFVSAHFNSCKLCLPWQGKVLIDDVFSHPSVEYKDKYKGQYKLLSQAIKAGLSHPNCRHTIANYFEGITRLPEVPDDDTALQNYEAEQKQRKLENAIRKAKRKAAGAVDDKNKVEATKDVRQLQKELRDHLKVNPKLKRHPHREKLYGIKTKFTANLNAVNFDSQTLLGADESVILEVDKALSKIYKQYPNLKGIITNTHLMDTGTAGIEMIIENKGISFSLGINKSLTVEYANKLAEQMYKTYKWTKKPGLEGIIMHEMGHVLNYDYYMRKHNLQYGVAYGDAPLQAFINDLEKNEFAVGIRQEVFNRLGLKDTPYNVKNNFSEYANNQTRSPASDFFAEAFSDYSDTRAKEVFFKVLDDVLSGRMK